jgi:hypothetical protein
VSVLVKVAKLKRMEYKKEGLAEEILSERIAYASKRLTDNRLKVLLLKRELEVNYKE